MPVMEMHGPIRIYLHHKHARDTVFIKIYSVKNRTDYVPESEIYYLKITLDIT